MTVGLLNLLKTLRENLRLPTNSREAYDLYLKGSETSGEESIKYLLKAIAINSTFSDASVALGKDYWVLAHWGKKRPEDYWRKSKEYLNKAIALDPQNSRAYSQLAIVQGNWDWDDKAGGNSLQKALALNPAVPPAFLGTAYMARGDEKRAYDYFEQGIKEHDMWMHFLPYTSPFFGKEMTQSSGI